MNRLARVAHASLELREGRAACGEGGRRRELGDDEMAAKIGLADAVKKVANRGTVYSVAPIIAGNATVYEVLVAAPDGKSTKFDIDAATGKVAVVR